MARLPIIGADNNNWGAVLNEFLQVSHRNDGTLCNSYEVVNVRDFGAIGNGQVNDQPAIQAAINFAASVEPGSVYIPPGTYRLTETLRAEIDNLTIFGTSQSVLLVDPPNDCAFPEGILANKGDTIPPAPVHHLTIENLIFEVKNGPNGNVSTGVIQLNNCHNCAVKNVIMRYTGPNPKPQNLDGIVTALGTTGLIQHCVIDGIPKVGIYIAAGSHDVCIDECEVRNTTGPLGQTAITISGSDRVTIRNCHAHHNGAWGLWIAVNGPVGQILPAPATNVQVIGGCYYNNLGGGIFIGSACDGAYPRNITLNGVSVLQNDDRGITIEAGTDISLINPTVIDSGGHGIWIENVPIGLNPLRSRRIQISNPTLLDNGRQVSVDVSGIGLRSARQVTITGGVYAKLSSQRRQVYNVAVYKGADEMQCEDIRILDIGAADGQNLSVAALDNHGNRDDNVATKRGYYRIQDVGQPEGVLPAPPGSEYVDWETGFVYRKVTGTGAIGWHQVDIG